MENYQTIWSLPWSWSISWSFSFWAAVLFVWAGLRPGRPLAFFAGDSPAFSASLSSPAPRWVNAICSPGISFVDSHYLQFLGRPLYLIHCYFSDRVCGRVYRCSSCSTSRSGYQCVHRCCLRDNKDIKKGRTTRCRSYHALGRLLDHDLWPMRSFSLDQLCDQACLWFVYWEIDPRCHLHHQWLWKSGMYVWSTTVSTHHSHYQPVDFGLCLFGLVLDQVCLGFSCWVKHFRCLLPLLHRYLTVTQLNNHGWHIAVQYLVRFQVVDRDLSSRRSCWFDQAYGHACLSFVFRRNHLAVRQSHHHRYLCQWDAELIQTIVSILPVSLSVPRWFAFVFWPGLRPGVPFAFLFGDSLSFSALSSPSPSSPVAKNHHSREW